MAVVGNFTHSRKLGFGGVPLEVLHENHGVRGLLHLFSGAAGVGCVWLRKFGVELFFYLELRGALPNTPLA
jgi:hypothetical protein